jgi:hypothetical protein
MYILRSCSKGNSHDFLKKKEILTEFLQVLGPKLMENRKPFHFKKTLVFYNFLQVIFSVWLFYQVISESIRPHQ